MEIVHRLPKHRSIILNREFRMLFWYVPLLNYDHTLPMKSITYQRTCAAAAVGTGCWCVRQYSVACSRLFVWINASIPCSLLKPISISCNVSCTSLHVLSECIQFHVCLCSVERPWQKHNADSMTHSLTSSQVHTDLSLIHIWRCRRIERCRSRWSPYH